MRTLTRRFTEGGRVRLSLALLACVAAIVGLVVPATTSGASHDVTKLTDSNFEIDTDANLTIDDDSPSIDWLNDATVPAFRTGVRVTTDTVSGGGDESFGNGTKEDTAVPSVVDGGIPPNKSDLKAFGLFIESGRFLNLFWTRVQDPSGTTNMDFEFNQSNTLSANGKTPVRTKDDFLVTYDLSRGGVDPTISVRRWLASGKWSGPTDITAQSDAAGAINTSAIESAAAGTLGALGPRTFGEASIDLQSVFGTSCGRIGSAYLKSRSSDSFTAALKDFVPPDTGINFNNCPPASPTTTHKAYLSDEATVGASGVPGTMTFHLFRAADASDGTPCGSDNEITLSSSYAGISVDSTGKASTPSTPFRATLNGVYNWIVDYAPGTGSQLLAGSSSCGSETTTITGLS